MRRDVRSVGGGEVASAEPLYASASLVVEPSVPAAISLPRGRLKDGSRASASLRTSTCGAPPRPTRWTSTRPGPRDLLPQRRGGPAHGRRLLLELVRLAEPV